MNARGKQEDSPESSNGGTSGSTNPHRVVILTTSSPYSGNATAAQRIRGCLSKDFDVTIAQHADFEGPEDFAVYARHRSVSAVIGIHAFRSGRLLIGAAGIRYAIVFGGTDLNCYADDADRLAIMTAALRDAKAAVCFTGKAQRRAVEIWPFLSDKTVVIPQGVEVCQPLTIGELGGSGGRLDLNNTYLLVAGLRPVKDVLFVYEAFETWASQPRGTGPRLGGTLPPKLVIVGPELDTNYTRTVKAALKYTKHVCYHQPVPQPELHVWIRRCSAVVNTSISEGMCGTVLEAMKLGTPVVARANGCNEEIVRHEETGLLFDTPKDFIQQLERLRSDQWLRRQLTSNAMSYVDRFHDTKVESQAYTQAVNKLLASL